MSVRPHRGPPFPLPARQVYLTHAGVAAFAFAVMATMLLGPATWLLGRTWRREPKFAPPAG